MESGQPAAGAPREADVELSPEQLTQLDRIFQEYRSQRGAVIPILQRAQDLVGYLPRSVLRLISQRTLIPLTQLYGVATFYAQFRLKRRGRHLVRVCDGTACHVRGSARSIEAIGKTMGVEPGGTSSDYKMTLEIVYCLGSCGLSPVALVDDQVCGRLSSDELVARLETLT
jgi:NADH-quinone oxidoreductase subunit E